MSNLRGLGRGISQLNEDGGKDKVVAKQKLDEKKSAPPNLASMSTSKPTRQEDRNFRNHYYEKVGFRGMEERKTIEAILKDDPISLEKCMNFSLRCSIPAADRLYVWKLLLGEEATHPNNKKEFDKWKERTYNDCKRLLKSAGRISDEWPTAKTLTVLWLLCDKVLNIDFNAQLLSDQSQHFYAIADSMLTLTDGKEVEAFWLAKGLAGVICKYGDDVITDLINLFRRILSTDTKLSKLYNHMEKIGLNEDLPLRPWISSGFAGVLKPAALVRVWDKLCCGALKLMSFVAVAMVDVKQNKIFGCQTSKEAIKCITTADEECQENMVQRGLEMWFSDGSHLLPPIDQNLKYNRSFIILGPGDKSFGPFLTAPKFHLTDMINIEGLTIKEEEDEPVDHVVT